MKAVERVDISAMTAKAFRQRFRSGEGVPCIITGALQGLEPCTPEFLTAKLPDAKLPARHYGKDHFKKPKTEWKKYSDLMQVTPAEFAALLHDRTAHVENIYMAQVAIGDTELGTLLRPIMQRLAETSGMQAAIDLNLWWGPAGHTEPLHYDSGDGTLLQLHGTKRAILFPPSQTRNLYPFPIRRNGIAPWVSQVYIDRPDYDRFPRMRDALEHKVDITVNAGEVLFIPTNWWHEVSSVSEGYICSLNRFWKVSPLSRLFTNRLTPVVYPLSLFALAMMRRKARKAAAQAGAA